jgi:hypothetical protein
MSGQSNPKGPTRISASIAVVAAGLAAVTGLGGSGWLVLLAPLGAGIVAGALWRGRVPLLAVGCACLIGAALATGLAGGAPVRLVLSVAATFVAWDLGEHAVTLGEQLGRRAVTARLEFLHAAGAITVATVGGGIAYLSFLLAGGGQPLVALLFLLVGSFALLTALRAT